MSERTTGGDREAVFFDFGGVLTSSLFDAFEQLGRSLGDDAGLPLRVLATDPEAAALLVQHEEGRIEQEEFERGYADRLAAHGLVTEADGLVDRLQAGLRPDPAMLALVEELRTQGRPVALVSNALGRDCYAGYDLAAMFDEVVVSSEVGIRKPSRRIYRIACDRLGVPPERAVMIDDLQHNLDGAARIGIAGVLHTDADTTRRGLEDLLAPSARAHEARS
ncbi:HAD family hydrolase [Aeromicrobium sp. CTD01-1L150]|uniref:HAD family hydrolase n=1 Tax=Aeromicrobium sp. CTD01-1L150 TaxID=3341830 RepID=UPI0035C23ED0